MTPAGLNGEGPKVEYYVAARPLAGQDVSGDAYAVVEFDGGVLVRVIDGLGHGQEAAKAARTATDFIGRNASEPLLELTQRCHEALKSTRGIVASFARFDALANSMSWLGVGNVEALLFQRNQEGEVKRTGLAPRGGVIGYTLSPLHCSDVDVNPGDLLVMATDGLAGAFIDSIDAQAGLEEMVEGLMTEHGKSSDDALILAARYLGGRAR